MPIHVTGEIVALYILLFRHTDGREKMGGSE
jgi:hypothetical protein